MSEEGELSSSIFFLFIIIISIVIRLGVSGSGNGKFSIVHAARFTWILIFRFTSSFRFNLFFCSLTLSAININGIFTSQINIVAMDETKTILTKWKKKNTWIQHNSPFAIENSSDFNDNFNFFSLFNICRCRRYSCRWHLCRCHFVISSNRICVIALMSTLCI